MILATRIASILKARLQTKVITEEANAFFIDLQNLNVCLEDRLSDTNFSKPENSPEQIIAEAVEILYKTWVAPVDRTPLTIIQDVNYFFNKAEALPDITLDSLLNKINEMKTLPMEKLLDNVEVEDLVSFTVKRILNLSAPEKFLVIQSKQAKLYKEFAPGVKVPSVCIKNEYFIYTGIFYSESKKVYMLSGVSDKNKDEAEALITVTVVPSTGLFTINFTSIHPMYYEELLSALCDGRYKKGFFYDTIEVPEYYTYNPKTDSTTLQEAIVVKPLSSSISTNKTLEENILYTLERLSKIVSSDASELITPYSIMGD